MAILPESNFRPKEENFLDNGSTQKSDTVEKGEDFLKDLHSDYATLLDTPARLQQFRTMVELTDHPESRRRAEDEIKANLFATRRIDIDHMGFTISWLTDPGIKNILGRDIAIPTIAFNRLQATVVGQLKEYQGVALPFFLDAINEPLRVILIPDESFDRTLPIPYEQRRRHEMTHAVHPGLEGMYPGEGGIVAELAAVAGEVTLPKEYAINNFFAPLDVNGIRPWEGFFIKYITDRLPKGEYTTASIKAASTWLENFLNSITFTRPNSEIVRRLMSCKTISDLEKLYEYLAKGDFERAGKYPHPVPLEPARFTVKRIQ